MNGTPTTSDILTLAEAAAYLRVSEEGLRADAERSHVPAVKIAGEWRFSKSVILDWFRRSTNRTAINAEEGRDQAEIERLRQAQAKGPREAIMATFGLWKNDPSAAQLVKQLEAEDS